MAEDRMLDYTTPTVSIVPTRQSKYALYAIIVLTSDLIWDIFDWPFDERKQFRIALVLWVLGVIFTIGGFWERDRKRELSWWAVGVAIIVFLTMSALLPSY